MEEFVFSTIATFSVNCPADDCEEGGIHDLKLEYINNKSVDEICLNIEKLSEVNSREEIENIIKKLSKLIIENNSDYKKDNLEVLEQIKECVLECWHNDLEVGRFN